MNSLDAEREKRMTNFKEFDATINKMKVFSFVEREEESVDKKERDKKK